MPSLHIELTNRCTLGCPACPRTDWANILKRPIDKMDLDYSLLDRFLDCPGGQAIDNFSLCGDYGDSIYYPKLLEFISHYRESKTFTIHTNGSRQKTVFWKNLAGLMTKDDTIIFAIDGLGEDNKLYRKNSHWESIIEGLDIMIASPARVKWQTIVFSFNEFKLIDIKKFAEERGAEYQQMRTHRFGEEWLKPSYQHIEKEFLFDDRYLQENMEILPQCRDSDEIPVVGYDGIFYPCDWIRNPRTFYKSMIWKDKWIDRLNIIDNNYDQVKATVREWADAVYKNSLSGNTVDVLCKMKCRKGLCND